MLSNFAVQLPFSVCAVWCVLMMLKTKKDYSDRLMLWILGLLAICFLSGSQHFSPNPDFKRLVITDIIMQFTSLSVFPIVCFYIRSGYEETKAGMLSYLLLLPSLFVLGANIAMTAALGVENCSILLESAYKGILIPDYLDAAEKTYVNVSRYSYHFVFFLSLALSLVYIFSKLLSGKFKFVHVSHFLRGLKSSFVPNIVCLFFIIFFILWGLCVIFDNLFMSIASIWNPIWSIVSAVILFLVGYVSVIPPLPGGYMNIERMRHPFNALYQTPQEFLQGIDSGPVAGASTSGYDKIMDSFKQLMITNKGFLNAGMTIDEISRQLNTNRTYVSKLVNIYYGMPFRDYINKLRIDYSKNLMTDEPDAVIDYIALKSGFQSSTQFIRKFRELEGMTPTVWKASMRKK